MKALLSACGVVAAIACTRPTRPSASPDGSVEQTAQGSRPPASLVVSFDGLGVGLQGPHGRWEGRNPSDNSLAVGRDYVFQIVNTRMASDDLLHADRGVPAVPLKSARS